HCCNTKGCENVLVLDGNMKNARQVCSCKNVSQLEFEGMDGSITVGILVFERPCGVVTDVRELFGSESKSQVYAHLHTLLVKDHMKNTDIICYDDACHLKKFAQNPVRSEKTSTSKKLSQIEILCDKFHFKNHVDRWCKTNCNPYNCDALKDVNTEVCEQLFSWLSGFSRITKHMNRWRFIFLMLYILDNHNEDISTENEYHS
ncbi:hypothetical protein QZH41_008639, partial [Actinostola sp. cb2023]